MANEDPVVQVTIKVDPVTKEIISVAPDRFVVHKLSDQVVRWTCIPDQQFTVEFENGSPFYESQFSKDHPCSGIARRNLVTDPNRSYKYVVRVGDKVRDPDGVVDK